jgi:hypothetical protein
MTAAITVTATFTLQRFTLTVAFNNPGPGDPFGTVTSNPGGINCTLNCAADFNFNQVVMLTAVPGSGSFFAGWSGGGCTGTGTCSVTMTQARTVTATFRVQQFPLTVNRSGDGSGRVTSSPTGIDCGNTCTADFVNHTMVTLTPIPNSSSHFDGWIGGGCEENFDCTVTMDAAVDVTASFGSGGTETGDRLQRGWHRR